MNFILSLTVHLLSTFYPIFTILHVCIRIRLLNTVPIQILIHNTACKGWESGPAEADPRGQEDKRFCKKNICPLKNNNSRLRPVVTSSNFSTFCMLFIVVMFLPEGAG